MGARLGVILNGKGAGNDQVREAIIQLREQGHAIEVRPTWEAGDVDRLVKELVELGCTTIVAGGGDGTQNEVSAAIFQIEEAKRPAMAVLPLGTANDFARGLGLPLEPMPALQIALSTEPVLIDLVQVNDRSFINMATAGYGTQITVETPELQKKLLGGLAYVMQGITKAGGANAISAKITSEDFNWQGKFMALALGNGIQAGGGQKMCPKASINNGKIEITVIEGEEILPTLWAQLTAGDEAENMITGQASALLLETDEAIYLNLDGEPLESSRFEVKVIPNALRLHVNADCPLLQANHSPN